MATAAPATSHPAAAHPATSHPAPRGACPFAPPPAYQQAVRDEPVTRVALWDGAPCWLVTRHQDTRDVLADPRFSADAARPGFPFLSAAARQIGAGKTSFIRMDDPEHSRLRRMLTGDFTLRKTAALRPAIQQVADRLFAAMTTGRTRADLVADFALPLPSLVICLLLGVPYEDHEFFQRCSRSLLNRDSPVEEVLAAQDALTEYLDTLTDSKRGNPDDGILSRLVERGELPTEEIGAMGRLLLIAGHETTANMTALSVLALLRHPDQLAHLRAHPEATPAAVEELLRWLSIVQTGVTRVAVEDVEVGGVLIRAGEGVICQLNTANRDEDRYPDGDTLDLTRDTRRHVAFGFGVHQCLGQPLARLELEIALDTLLRGLPDLRLAVPFEEIRFRHEMTVYGIETLPVTW
ncbi:MULTISPECIES: cytochrome P450 [Kitasatospora]|uniref:Putative cytochrome P450 n=1 Tax=Kitasatospora setae (strain ATCC 33774 / DSM 43861 / JCM 3304 / KCC A-0304 / NBRC 14216 / KM-6054) TaxID=452652 RepID=E4N5M4_KITSK|nr:MULTISPECIES: cytochrome P450 [Kitasatospora]BAJ26505.1 putative cytochrome P450 [Kitasatospora setae KM-6054]